MVNGSANSRAEFAGAAVAQAVLAVGGTKGLGTLGKAEKLSQVTSLTSKTEKLAAAGATVESMAASTGRLEKAISTTINKGAGKGANNPVVTNSIKVGQEAHRQLEAEGLSKWIPEQTIKLPNGSVVRKDGVGITNSNDVRIIKPDTPSGRAAAVKRADLMTENGYNPTIDYYNPADPRFQPGSPTYIGPRK